MDAGPLVSVVIATRDRPQILAQCLEAVLAQEYSPREIVVVDNSCSDQSEQIVAELGITQYVRESSGTDNVSYLKNQGIRQSRGQIVALLDDDSIVEPGWLEAVVAVFKDASVGGVTGRVIEDAFPVDVSPDVAWLSPRDDMLCNFNNLWPEPVEVDYLYGCNMAWRRSVLEKAGGFDPWMSYSRGEQELSLRVKQAGYRLLFHPDVVVRHLRAPRAEGTVQRSGAKDFRSRMIHCRSLTYQYARHFGLSRDLLHLTLWRLPKGDLGAFRRQPSGTHLVMPGVTLLGVLWGYLYAGLAAAGLHSAPKVV